MENKNAVRVIVTDDHTMIRDGLKSILEQDKGIQVVGEAANGEELLALLAHTPADVVLMDINMPKMDGFKATRRVRQEHPDTKVIALSMLNDMPTVERLIASGATGYLLKTSGKEELSSAIRLVASGNTYICSDLSMAMLNKSVQPKAQAEPDTGKGRSLSKRELEILSLVAEGYTNAAIAEKLFTSKRTIETHRQNIIDKTQTKNTANLIKYAIQHKLIPIDEPEQ